MKPINHTNLVNGVQIEWTNPDGTMAVVVVKQLSIRQLYQFVTYAKEAKTPEIVALATGKPIEWVDGLDLDVFAELAKVAMQLNFPRAMKVVQGGDPIMATELSPLLEKFVERTKSLSKLQGEASDALSALSPSPAPSGSAAETGSESSTTHPSDSTPYSAKGIVTTPGGTAG
ncbi:MAG: hypothetical protein SFV32_12765 [Opitutaceae bacterium]|nr:hypothetical protein [Opitutaceae bacterium]